MAIQHKAVYAILSYKIIKYVTLVSNFVTLLFFYYLIYNI